MPRTFRSGVDLPVRSRPPGRLARLRQMLDSSLHRISQTHPADVAQALVPAVSRLISTPFRGGDTVSKRSVGMSLCVPRRETSLAPESLDRCSLWIEALKPSFLESADAAGMSACATSLHPNTCEKCRLAQLTSLHAPLCRVAGARDFRF